MNRPLLAVVAFCAMAGSLAFAQQSAADAPSLSGPGAGAARGPRWSRNRTAAPSPSDTAGEPANPELQPAALLERAYAITRDLPLETRAYLLGWMLDPASRIEPQIAQAWADELFQMAHDLSDPQQRGPAEIQAVDALSRIDVVHALEVFRQMDADIIMNGRVMPLDVRDSAARNLFSELLRKKGVPALPVLEQEAQRLAESGAYPYIAMGFAADQILHKDRSLAEKMFADAVAAYQQSTPTLVGNAEFVTMLRDSSFYAQRADAQQAVTAVVNNLLSHPDDGDENFKKAQLSFQGVAIDTPTDYLLLQLLPVVRRLQPDLLDTVAQSRPALGKAVSMAGTMTQGNPFPHSVGELAPPPAANPDQAVVNRIQRAASDDPQAALAISNQLQDPAVRAQALSAVASGMVSKDPQQAAQLLSNAQDLAAKIDDKRKQLQAIIAMAQAGNRMNNQAVLRDSLARGFVLGNELLQLDEDNGTPPSFTLLSPLVRAGAHTQLETVVAGIDGIQNLEVKAQLLVLTAQSMPRPRPPRTQTAPAPEEKSADAQKSASVTSSQ